VLVSGWESALEETDPEPPVALPFADGTDPRTQPAVRLGLNRVHGLSEAAARRLLAARAARLRERLCLPSDAPLPTPLPGPPQVFAFDSVEDLARAARLERRDLHALAQADALAQLAGHRANAHWESVALAAMPALLADARFDETPVALAAPNEGSEIVADYASIGIPMGRHPLALLRPWLVAFRVQPAAVLRDYPNGRLARASGLVTHRQRPETAKGTIFVTLEDETGAVNVIVWPTLLERYRKEVLAARLLTVYGVWQRDEETGGQVMHLVAQRVVDHTALLGRLRTGSRDFR